MKWIKRLLAPELADIENRLALAEATIDNLIDWMGRGGKKNAKVDLISDFWENRTPITELFHGHHESRLTVRAIRCLAEAGYYTVEEAAKLTEKQIIDLPGIGVKAAGHILDRLNAWRGL